MVAVMAQDQQLLQWCKKLPKVELHAHLNGSIRDSTLLELAEDLGVISFPEFKTIILKGERTLSECFRLFDLIHLLTTDHSIITRITKEVIEDFAADNVIYLELRTTPKHNEAIGMSKRSYMEAVLAGLDAANTSLSSQQRGKSQVQVRLLLSIDRRESTDAAMETARLALELRNRGVVGIDLSGNPIVGEWATFLPALTWAREQSIRITLHCGEVSNTKEIQAMLDFKPDRFGHMCYLEDIQWDALLASKVPVEVCLTSNVRTKSVQSIDDHHFTMLYEGNHPMVICTDDPGVFATKLSHEYALAGDSFELSRKELLRLSKAAINFAFVDEQMKHNLHTVFTENMPDQQ